MDLVILAPVSFSAGLRIALHPGSLLRLYTADKTASVVNETKGAISLSIPDAVKASEIVVLVLL